MPGLPHHAIVRANAGARVFSRPADFLAFLDLVAEAGERAPVAVLGYCLMPNHVHALRAGLVEQVEAWRWSSLAARENGAPPEWLERPALPRGWRAYVNEAQTAAELEALRRSVNRGYPFGAQDWAETQATALGFSARPRGRPKK